MKLFSKTTSDAQGRETSKGGNECIITRYYNGNLPVFEVTFHDDGEKRGTLEIMSYNDGKTRTINYDSDNDTRTA